MKTLLLIVFTGIGFLFHAQGLNQGAISTNLGYDGGIHGTVYTQKHNYSQIINHRNIS